MPPQRNLERELAVVADYLLKDSVGNHVFSFEQIAYNHKVSTSTICRILNRHSVPPRRNLERDLAVINDYRLKDSDGEYVFYPVEIVDKYKISSWALYDILALNGVPRRTTKKKLRSDLYSYSDVISNPKLLNEMIDKYRSKKLNGDYVYSFLKFLELNNISEYTWAKICQEKGIENRRIVSSGANKKRKPHSKKNSVEDLEPRIHEVVGAYNLVDGNGEPVYKLRKLYLKFGCSSTTFYNLLRMACDIHKLHVSFRRGLSN